MSVKCWQDLGFDHFSLPLTSLVLRTLRPLVWQPAITPMMPGGIGTPVFPVNMVGSRAQQRVPVAFESSKTEVMARAISWRLWAVFHERVRVTTPTIDWFDEWPKDALLSVAERYFEGVDLGTPEIKKEICEACVEMHYSVGRTSEAFFAELRRKTYTTPTSYLELLNLYQSMLGEQRTIVQQKIAHYQGGVNKLVDTNKVVDKLKKELVQMQPVLAQAAKDTQQLLEEVATDQANADEVKQKVTKEEAEVGEIAKEAQAIAADAQRDLDEAMPAYHSAVEALNKLDKKDIQEVKSYAKPPALVMTVMEAVCLLMGQKTDWSDAKVLLNQSNFLQQLAEYDKDNIPEKKIKVRGSSAQLGAIRRNSAQFGAIL